MTEMQEALQAVGLGGIQLAPAKFPEGKTIVAVRLDRDESVSGKFITAISKGWQPSGVAIALCNGHVKAANYIFGRWSNGVPKVSACHLVRCPKCGKTMLMPLAVWEAKDNARRAGSKDNLDTLSGYELLRRYGSCTCGGRWEENPEEEKKDLTAFAGEVLKALERAEHVGKFLPPRAFTVHAKSEEVDLGEDWKWLQDAMSSSGRSAIPFDQNRDGDTIVYNPGQWMGWSDDFDASGLFFLEGGLDRKGRARGFNPCEVHGL